MTELTTAASERVPLATFLATLPADVAAQLKAQAERIDALERQVVGVRGIENQLKVPFFVSVAMFAVGLVAFFASGRDLTLVRTLIGEVGLCLLLSALPVLAIYYAFKVRHRTRADQAAFEANRNHFIPHGAIYFPAAEPDRTPIVVLVDPDKAYQARPGKNDKVKAGWIW